MTKTEQIKALQSEVIEHRIRLERLEKRVNLLEDIVRRAWRASTVGHRMIRALKKA